MNRSQEGKVTYWLTPVQSDGLRAAEDLIRTLVGREGIFAFGERTSARDSLRPGDFICFYASRKGIVAHARAAKAPERKPHNSISYERHPWLVELEDPELYIDNPVIIDEPIRKRLDAFRGRKPNTYWSWFVQMTRRISSHDFLVLTRGADQISIK